MKFAFATCVKLGYSCIQSIYSIGGKLDLIITLKDEVDPNKSGRVFLDSFSKENTVKLLKVNHINDSEAIKTIKENEIDWLFIIGWSQIASEAVINSPNLGVIGAHPTLLPKGRGRASIPWAIIKNLNYTGLTFFKIDKGVDTGDILYQDKISITSEETATSLYDKVNLAHKNSIVTVWEKLINGTIKPIPQNNNLATYWEGRRPKDGRLSSLMIVEEVERLVRATTKPYPGAFIEIEDEKIIIWEGRIVDNTKEENFVLKFADGYYAVLKYDISPIKR